MGREMIFDQKFTDLMVKFAGERDKKEIVTRIGEDGEKKVVLHLRKVINSVKKISIVGIGEELEKEFPVNFADKNYYIRYQINLFHEEKEGKRMEEEDQNGGATCNSEGSSSIKHKRCKPRIDMDLYYGGPLLEDLKIMVIPETTIKLFREMKEKAKQKYDFIQYLKRECVFPKHDSNADYIFENIKSEVRTTRFNLLDDQFLKDAIDEHIWGQAAKQDIHLYYEYQLFVADNYTCIRSIKNASDFFERGTNINAAKKYFDHFNHKKLLKEFKYVRRSSSLETSDYIKAAAVKHERSLLQHHRDWELRNGYSVDAVYNYLFKTRLEVDKRSDEEQVKEILNTNYPFCGVLWNSLLNALINELVGGSSRSCPLYSC